MSTQPETPTAPTNDLHADTGFSALGIAPRFLQQPQPQPQQQPQTAAAQPVIDVAPQQQAPVAAHDEDISVGYTVDGHTFTSLELARGFRAAKAAKAHFAERMAAIAAKVGLSRKQTKELQQFQTSLLQAVADDPLVIDLVRTFAGYSFPETPARKSRPRRPRSVAAPAADTTAPAVKKAARPRRAKSAEAGETETPKKAARPRRAKAADAPARPRRSKPADGTTPARSRRKTTERIAANVPSLGGLPPP